MYSNGKLNNAIQKSQRQVSAINNAPNVADASSQQNDPASKAPNWSKQSNQRGKWKRGSFRGAGPGFQDAPLAPVTESRGALHDTNEYEFKGTPGEGVTYSYYDQMPNSQLGPGIYQRKSNGALYFVKTGLHAQEHRGRMIDWKRDIANNRGVGIAPNAAARSEYTAQRLLSTLATDKNHIQPLPATLHADGLGGAEVPSGYKIHPEEGIYSVTQKIPKAKLWRQLDAEGRIDRNRQKDTASGFAVDALLDVADLHSENKMIGEGHKGVYRIDTGGYLGLSPFGRLKHERGDDSPNSFFGADYDKLTMLPSFMESFRWHHPELHLTHDEMMDQIKHTIDTYKNRRDQIAKDVEHHHDPEKLLQVLDKRVQVMERTYNLYKDRPQEFLLDAQAGKQRQSESEVERSKVRREQRDAIQRQLAGRRMLMRDRKDKLQQKVDALRQEAVGKKNLTTALALDPAIRRNAQMYAKTEDMITGGKFGPQKPATNGSPNDWNASEAADKYVSQMKRKLKGDPAGNSAERAWARMNPYARRELQAKFDANRPNPVLNDFGGADLTFGRLRPSNYKTNAPNLNRGTEAYTGVTEGDPTKVSGGFLRPRNFAAENIEQYDARKAKEKRAKDRIGQYQAKRREVYNRAVYGQEPDISTKELGQINGVDVDRVRRKLVDAILYDQPKNAWDRQIQYGNLPDFMTGRRGARLADLDVTQLMQMARQKGIKVNRALARRAGQVAQLQQLQQQRKIAKLDISGSRFPELVGKPNNLTQNFPKYETGGEFVRPGNLEQYVQQLNQRRKERLLNAAEVNRGEIQYRLGHKRRVANAYAVLDKLKNMSPTQRAEWYKNPNSDDLAAIRNNRWELEGVTDSKGRVNPRILDRLLRYRPFTMQESTRNMYNDAVAQRGVLERQLQRQQAKIDKMKN